MIQRQPWPAPNSDFFNTITMEMPFKLWLMRRNDSRVGPLMAQKRQYIVITAGGHGVLGTRYGDYTLAYALPRA